MAQNSYTTYIHDFPTFHGLPVPTTTYRHPQIPYATVVSSHLSVARLIARLDPDFDHSLLHSYFCRRSYCKYHHPYGY